MAANAPVLRSRISAISSSNACRFTSLSRPNNRNRRKSLSAVSRNQESFRPEQLLPGGEFRFELFNKFHFDWNVDVAFVVSVAQKLAYSRTSDLAIIPSKFVHVHADELAGEPRVHVACV